MPYGWEPPEIIWQVQQYLSVYPWVWATEVQYGLPRGMLLAVGSRETGLGLQYANGSELGDGGYAAGTWQFDLHPQNWSPARAAIWNRIHGGDCVYAADIAAQTLKGHLDAVGTVVGAADEYNDGSIPYDSATTGGDYGSDVVSRMLVIRSYFPPSAPAISPPKEVDMFLVRAAGPGGSLTHKFGKGAVFLMLGNGNRRYIDNPTRLALYTPILGDNIPDWPASEVDAWPPD